ncbi:hypothetical protein Bca52824_048553 [Brassica carinata]|uniref:Uncharacterized protein n=1 Tax=Brassica carinata TaxID=52824 RepID=A0A8X7RGV6_BRACI|nr:hypothetical protein Bca52824_048553 [Brassica carinata]
MEFKKLPIFICKDKSSSFSALTAKHLWKKFKEVAKFEEEKEESKDASQAAGLLEKLTVEEKKEKPVEKVASAEAEKAVEEKKTKDSVPSA